MNKEQDLKGKKGCLFYCKKTYDLKARRGCGSGERSVLYSPLKAKTSILVAGNQGRYVETERTGITEGSGAEQMRGGGSARALNRRAEEDGRVEALPSLCG